MREICIAILRRSLEYGHDWDNDEVVAIDSYTTRLTIRDIEFVSKKINFNGIMSVTGYTIPKY